MIDAMPTVQLLQLTDPHLFGEPATELYGLNTALSFRLALESAFAEGPVPDAILATGDIGDDMSEAAYAGFRRALEGRASRVFCLPGNHDDPALMARLLEGDGFQYCGRARLGAWGLVLLDTHVPGRPHGRLADAELVRLDADLRALHDVPVLVCLHHPPVPVGSRWLDGVGLENGDAFFDVVDRHPQVRCVLAGHVHQEFDQMRGSVRVLTTPSTCAQFAPRTEHCVMDRRPPGYRWISLHADGSLTTQVGWLDHLVGEPRDESESRR
jgi:Icc protein